MVFGSKEAFAIEAMLEPNLITPSAVWGRMCIWCQDESIGDYAEEHCGLYPSYTSFRLLRLMLATQWLPEFEGLSDVALWNHLDGLLYGSHSDTELDDNRFSEQCQRVWEEYGRFSFLTNWGEQFDTSGKSFIVCEPEGRVRILNRSFLNGISRACSLEEITHAIDSYLAWFEGESGRLNGATL